MVLVVLVMLCSICCNNSVMDCTVFWSWALTSLVLLLGLRLLIELMILELSAMPSSNALWVLERSLAVICEEWAFKGSELPLSPMICWEMLEI
ncbi:hypothetical protein Neuguinea66_07450 [Helicobacter pylori]